MDNAVNHCDRSTSESCDSFDPSSLRCFQAERVTATAAIKTPYMDLFA